MSVNASVVTNVKQDALIVPSSAVKTQNGTSYVLVFNSLPLGVSTTTAESAGFVSDIAPTQQEVTVGLTNDTESEILSGLSDGQLVVSRSAANTTTKAATNNGSILSALGAGGPGGGGGGGTLRTTTGNASARTTTTGR
jgi:multidrug efflux pump subunit AcrA (membrane-fusion protein)